LDHKATPNFQATSPVTRSGFRKNNLAKLDLVCQGVEQSVAVAYRGLFQIFRSPGRMPELVLYYFPSCPFCVVVLDCLDRLDLKIPMRDILTEAGARGDLMEIGGKTQVPCLVIDGKPLYESRDIIDWLEANAG
jgi:glutaredoxin